MRVVPNPPPSSFPVDVVESDPWAARPKGAPIPVTPIVTLRVPFVRDVDGRRKAAKKAASDYFSGKRGEPGVNVADDKIIATFTKPRPADR